MSFRLFIVGALVAGLALAAWVFRDVEPLRRGWSAAHSTLDATIAPGAATLRKCRSADGRVSYTGSVCPPGSREQGITGGSVSVLPGPAAAPASAAQPGGSVLRSLAGPDAADLQRRRIDKVVDQ